MNHRGERAVRRRNHKQQTRPRTFTHPPLSHPILEELMHCWFEAHAEGAASSLEVH